MSPGKTTDWQEKKEKEFLLKAKLNEKNLQALEKADKVDGELGLATPSMMLACEDAVVKSEVPSLEKLKELNKTCRISQLLICRKHNIYIYVYICMYTHV